MMNILNALTQFVTKSSTRSPLLALALAAVSTMANAAESPPQLMTVQSFITDDAGTPVGNTSPENKVMQFIIFEEEEGGDSVFAESQTVTVDKGYFSAILGEGTAISGDLKHNLATAFVGSTASDRYIEIQVDNGGTDFQTLSPRLRILPSAYSFLSSYANVAGSVDNAVINTAALDDGAVTSAKVSDNSLTAADLGTNSVGADEISTGAVGTNEIANGSIGYLDLANDSVRNAAIATSAVGSDEIAPDSIQAWDLATSSVYSAEIARDAVRADEIQAGAVGASEIAANAVGASEITANAVGTSELAPNVELQGAVGINKRVSNVDLTIGPATTGSATDRLRIYSTDDTTLAIFVNFVGQPFSIFGWFTGSDRKLKQDIAPLENLLEGVLKLKPVSYHLKSAPEMGEQIGFIAQDVQEVFPQTVIDSGEFLSLSYHQFGVLAIGGIQELNGKVETLETENAALDQKNADLEARLSALEALVESLAK